MERSQYTTSSTHLTNLLLPFKTADIAISPDSTLHPSTMSLIIVLKHALKHEYPSICAQSILRYSHGSKLLRYLALRTIPGCISLACQRPCDGSLIGKSNAGIKLAGWSFLRGGIEMIMASVRTRATLSKIMRIQSHGSDAGCIKSLKFSWHRRNEES